MTDLDVDHLLLEAEAKWSLNDDEGAAALLEEALTAVWGLPDEVARVSEAATRLAEARESEPMSTVARRAAAGAEALEPFTSSTGGVGAQHDEKRVPGRRLYLGLIQLAVFTIVVIGLLVVQYLRVLR